MPEPIHKFNGGKGATLCFQCNVIMHTGFTDQNICEKCGVMTGEEKVSCFECDDGHYVMEKQDYETTDGKGQRLVIPDVPHCVCKSCGDTVLSAESCRIIEQARQEAGVVYRNRIKAKSA